MVVLKDFKMKRGFSLVEMAVVVLLLGLAMDAVSSEFKHYMAIKATSDTSARRDLIKQAFTRYQILWGGLPCPASPTLPPGDINAGRSNCKMGTNLLSESPPPSANPMGYKYCDVGPNPPSDPPSGICVVAGARFTSNNPTWSSTPSPGIASFNDPVLIGAIPYIDLGLSMSDSIDGWGNRMTYAVSYYLTFDPSNPSQNPFNSDLGVINVETYDTTNNVIIPMKNTHLSTGPAGAIPDSFMLAIVSHGPDGKGAWNYNGQQLVPCDMTPIDKGSSAPSPMSTGRDNENCNGDSVFLSDDSNTLHSLVQGPYFYDDAFVQTDITLYADKWRALSQPNLIVNSGGAAAGAGNGSIGIGTASPADPENPGGSVLDVNGNIKTPNFQADMFCDKNTLNCFSATQLLFSASGSSAGGAMVGIANSEPQGLNSINTTGIIPSTCASPTLVSGIDINGNLVCSNLP